MALQPLSPNSQCVECIAPLLRGLKKLVFQLHRPSGGFRGSICHHPKIERELSNNFWKDVSNSR